MDNLSDIDAKERIDLESAWEIYADIVFSDSNYRSSLRQLRQQSQQGTHEEAEIVFKKLENLENSLKKQFLGLLKNGYFNAYGYDLKAERTSGESLKIPKAIFDSRVESFQINWDENWVEAHDKRFIGITVAVNLDKLKAELPNRFENTSPINADSKNLKLPGPIAQSTDKHRQRPGAKPNEELRQIVIAECNRRFGDFFDWANNKQIVQANKIAKELYPNKFDGRGLGRTSYLSSRKLFQQKQ